MPDTTIPHQEARQELQLAAGSLKVEADTLWLLDQTKLPHQQVWLPMNQEADLMAAIKGLKVRGAPLIGIAAAVYVALQSSRLDAALLHGLIDRLLTSRPTAVNLSLNLEAMRQVLEAHPAAEQRAKQLPAMARQLFDQEAKMCADLAQAGQQVIHPLKQAGKAKILTHCNTGSLATIGVGTAIGVITEAAKAGKVAKVWVSETRPLLQGGRLTAFEMVKAGIPHQIVTDSMAAYLMALQEVDLVVVGADRIAVNGDVANKIGTYSLAVACHSHGVPFYVAAPATTYDPDCTSGSEIPIEQRPAAEVKGFHFDPRDESAGGVAWSPEASEVFNPAFDVTPSRLISGYILPGGVAYHPAHITQLLTSATP